MPKVDHDQLLQPDFKESGISSSRRKNYQNTEAMKKARLRNLEKAHRTKDDKPPRLPKAMSHKQYDDMLMARRYYSYLPNPEEAMLYYHARKENAGVLKMIEKMKRARAKAEKVKSKAS